MSSEYGTFELNSLGPSLENGSHDQGVVKRQGRGCGLRSLAISVGLSAVIVGVLSASIFFCVFDKMPLLGPNIARQGRSLSLEDEKCGLERVPLVVFSFDGFARDYLDRKTMKSFDFMAKNGVRAEYMLPSFQAKTFPNHYTMATGLYPGYHGIVDASVFDETIGPLPVDVRGNDVSAYYEYNGEPIWALFRRLAGGRVACFQYPGCVQYPRNKPDLIDPFTGSEANRAVFDKVIDQLLKEESPDLILAYLEEPDHTRHQEKANSTKVETSLHRLDVNLQQFFATLERVGKMKCTNVVVLSDHGFMDVTNYVSLSNLGLSAKHVISGVVTRLHKRNTGPNSEDILSGIPCNSEKNGFRAFTRRTLPPRLHFTATKRSGDLFLLAESGTILIDERPGDLVPNDRQLGSNHGWDYTVPEMRMIFFAMGPDFKKNTVIPPFQNVEVFNLLTELLQISGPENNGTIGALWSALKTPSRRVRDPFYENNILIPKCTASNYSSLYLHARNYITGLFEDSLPMAVDQLQEGTCFTKLGASGYQISTNTGRVLIINSINGAAFYRDLEKVLKFETVATSEFYEKCWRALYKKTIEYLERFTRMLVINGWAHNFNSHYFYQVLIRCQDRKWDNDGWHCEDPKQTQTLGFLIPMEFSDHNCLPPDELLFEYTARVKDVEAISGLRFFTDYSKIPYEIGVKIKTNITMELW